MRLGFFSERHLLIPPALLNTAVGFGLRHYPFALKRQLLAPLLQRIFAQPIAAGELDFMRSRRIALRLDDFNDTLQFTFDGCRLTPIASTRAADVTIAGDSDVFLLLATRNTDPDTLFFHRRLSIEGDTELGLAVKNLIDSLDEDQLPQWMRQLIAITRRLQTRAAA